MPNRPTASRFILSRHAREELQRRSIPVALVHRVLDEPEQIVPEHGGKKALQSRIDFGNGTIFLLRVIVADDVAPPIVVTVYRTSRIAKYWRD